MPTGVNVKLQARNEQGKSVLDINSVPMDDDSMEKLIAALTAQLTARREERAEGK